MSRLLGCVINAPPYHHRLKKPQPFAAKSAALAPVLTALMAVPGSIFMSPHDWCMSTFTLAGKHEHVNSRRTCLHTCMDNPTRAQEMTPDFSRNCDYHDPDSIMQ